MRKIFIGAVIILFAFICFLLINYFIVSEQTEFNESDNQTFNDSRNFLSEGNINCPPIFTHEFTDFSKIDAFQPIGSISGASRGRSYITISAGESVPVYSPVDATLVSVIYAYRGPNTTQGEYGFKFNLGCNATLLLDHVDSISEELKKYSPAEPSRSTATDDSLSIKIKAGTLLGYSDGTPQARTFDFLVIDKNTKTFFINPSRWQWEQSLYSICPYDLYEESLKKKYYEKIGESYEDGFKKAENCGNISYDIPNTISGGWFVDEKATDINGEFVLIGERMGVVDLTVKTASEGTILRISDYNPEKLPKDVGIGESVCYRGFNNDWVSVHLLDAEIIELSNGQGDCSSPASGKKEYYR